MVTLLSACAPSSYLIRKPAPSGISGSAASTPQPATLNLVDERKETDRTFSSGLLPAALRTEAGPVEPAAFLAEHLQGELASRGIAVRVSQGQAGQPGVYLQTFKMVNHRVSGFSPFVTFTFLSADVDTPAGRKRMSAFVKRGKVPVWSFDEVIEPTLSQPLGLAVKELASKIAGQVYGWRASDSQLATLLGRVDAGIKLEGDAYLNVYALGFSNHPGAQERLVQLTGHADEYVRLAAISSLGTLGSAEKFKLLKSLYENRDGLWQDRAMAIKSIGDLGTSEARAYLAEELKRWEAKGADKEAAWTAQIIRLFI